MLAGRHKGGVEGDNRKRGHRHGKKKSLHNWDGVKEKERTKRPGPKTRWGRKEPEREKKDINEENRQRKSKKGKKTQKKSLHIEKKKHCRTTRKKRPTRRSDQFAQNFVGFSGKITVGNPL